MCAFLCVTCVHRYQCSGGVLIFFEYAVMLCWEKQENRSSVANWDRSALIQPINESPIF